MNDLEKVIDGIDLGLPAPLEEPERQYYFIKKGREYVTERSKELGRDLTCSIQTFGCQMNVRDSEKLAGILEQMGYVRTESENADFIIYNTCTVRENANRKVYGHLGLMKHLKEKNPEMKIALCGCMMQEQHVVTTISKSYRFVDMVFGTHNVYKLAEIFVNRIESGSMVIDIWKDAKEVVEDLPAVREFPFKSGVNIMFGCNNFCTYCIVPYVRGRERSRNPEDIIAECERLAAELLRRVCAIEKIQRVRFMTSHPKDLSDELIDVIAENPKICRHLHLPVQSGSTKILNAMNRRYTKESYLALVDRIRAKVPEISLTTDIIVGFPGETEEDFLETMDVVEKVQYDTAFTFIYSKRTGTPAAGMENGSTKEEIQDRYNRLLRRVQEISDVKTLAIKGQTQPVLVEGFDEKGDGLLTGRLSNNILVHFPGGAEMVGKILNVKLVECKGFYYMGELAE